MSTINYNIAIIGAGAAGLHLALAMLNDPYFENKRILILEKTAKDQNDRTWCFWEKGEGLWDALIQQSWTHGDFFYKDTTVPLSLTPYRYKMLRSIDFYEFAKKKILASSLFHWVGEEVVDVVNGAPLQIKGLHSEYTADIVFDSRIPVEFTTLKDSSTRLLQHFKGWVIKTNYDAFDVNRFTLMDFRLTWPNTTSFTYVLPLNKREALVEFTLFTTSLLQKNEYEQLLKNYLKDILKISSFEIVEQEAGVIPMSDFPFEKYSSGNHIRIGTGGGWVKPSTGYSFKNCERNSSKLIENLKQHKHLNEGLLKIKSRIYDTLFLDVLYRQNDRGPALFNTMYSKIPVQTIFAFLDDQTSIRQDLFVISRFPPLPFLFSIVKKIIQRWNKF
jgi:lycopene beta-cyclase